MSLRETLDIIRSAPEPPNEETTKLQIVVPILAELGWDARRQEIVYEHPVGGGKGGRVDIALMGPNRLVALIEVKRPGINLGHHVSQMLGYAFYEGVDICVLTTGLEWQLYLPMEHGPPEERRFTAFHIKRGENVETELETYLSKDNLLSGQAKEKAKKVLQNAKIKAELPRIIQSILTEPDDELVELIRQQTEKSINLRPSRDQAIEALREQTSPTPKPGKPVTPPTPPPDDDLGIVDPKPPPPKLTRIRLWGEYHDVNHGIDVLILVTEALIRHHGADHLLNLRSPSGRPYLSRDPDYFNRAKEVGSTGLYLNRNLPIYQLIKRAYTLLNRCGHPSSDLEILEV